MSARPGRFQPILNARWFAAVYETPLWRPLHTRIVSGRSWSDEIRRSIALSRPEPGALVADLGCGTGRAALAFARAVPAGTVIGLDLSRNMLRRARSASARAGAGSVFWAQGDILELPFRDGVLDRALCAGTIHLFADPCPALREIGRALKPGGILTVMTVARAQRGWPARLQARLMRKGAAFFFDPAGLDALLDRAGFEGAKAELRRLSLIFSAKKKG